MLLSYWVHARTVDSRLYAPLRDGLHLLKVVLVREIVSQSMGMTVQRRRFKQLRLLAAISVQADPG